MYILGISCYYHDSAAALIRDGELVAAAEEERFSRKKHDSGFPRNAINFCLRHAGITADDLDYVVFYEKPLLKFERILMTLLNTWPRSWGVFREALISWFNEKLWIKSEILAHLGIPAEKLLFSEHHVSHASSAFFTSPFDEAAIVTVDGVGEWATATVAYGRADWDGSGTNEIKMLREIRFPHSLGLLYSAFTAYLGFKVNNGEYKVMGMAPFGEPRYVDKVYKLINVADDGSFTLNLEYFSYPYALRHTYNRKFVELFGPERVPESEFFTPRTHPGRDGATARENQRFADIAASIQRVTEDVMLKIVRFAHEQTGSRKLCMAGGVALNSVANGRILREGPFDEVFIQPAAGDSGGALGAALYAYHVLLGKPRKFVQEHNYWGAAYSTDEIKGFLDANDVHYTSFDDPEKLADLVVDSLMEGKVVGWFKDRFEWGPRALGNRSILADPRREDMKQIVNLKIKFREPFRPFAPVVLEERTSEFFEIENPGKHYPARFMLLVTNIPEDKRDVIPAVTHVNGSGRLQTIRREWNPAYYRIVEKFGEATGVPVLLNTSFNLRGEPIVNTPANAFNTFMRSGLDLLVMNNRFVISKEDL